MLRIVRGDPSDEEIAAVTAVVIALPTARREETAPTRSAWADRTRLLRTPLHPGPGAWRASALPR